MSPTERVDPQPRIHVYYSLATNSAAIYVDGQLDATDTSPEPLWARALELAGVDITPDEAFLLGGAQPAKSLKDRDAYNTARKAAERDADQLLAQAKALEQQATALRTQAKARLDASADTPGVGREP